MTISPVDAADPFGRGATDLMASAVTSAPLFAKMNASSSGLPDHVGPQDLELSFLSEFLLHEDFAIDAAPTDSHSDAMEVETPRHAVSSPSNSSTSGGEALPSESLDRKARRRQQVAISARRHRSRKKHELLELRRDVSQLTAQLETMRSRHKMTRPSSAVAEWEERAMAQRRKRRQAEGQNEELRRAIFLQSQFLYDLKSVFSGAPAFTADLNLRQLLHTYSRLGRHPRSRARDLEAICSPAKLHMAMDILRRQTEAIRFTTPHIRTQLLEANDMFGATIVSVYAFDTTDVVRVFRATCKAIQASGGVWPEFTDVTGSVGLQIVDTVKAKNILYGTQAPRFQRTAESAIMAAAPSSSSSRSSDEGVTTAARVVSFWERQ
ncbi:hypothetical protein P43SY_005306 [Pythium insidiosum]|uniref:BZIP domain-containing protein n=1 Tax=Pythium insidiosum TaxID=114742 RepID=A0AAD5LDE0_PYTIN|nr:hypothetical protein P43SY_005306 [Pythium insidiosum]